MTLAIDWTRCAGHGICAALLPTHISLDEWGYPVVHNVDDIDDTDVKRVVSVCPALALRSEQR